MIAPKRRRSDRGWRWLIRENWYRDVWLLAVTGLVLWAVILSYNNARDAKRLSRATCAATSAVIDAGRATLKSGAVLKPEEFRKALEDLGLPPANRRILQSKRAAEAYGRSIAQAVERATGKKGLARKNGTLNCKRF